MPDPDDTPPQHRSNRDLGMPTGVHKTPITINERGQRVRARDGGPDAPVQRDGAAAGMDAAIAALRASFEAYVGENDSRFITGPGMSGTFGNGPSWNPNAAGAVGTAGGGEGGDTPVNPYTMLNTGSTGNTDTWPAVNAGGAYDGVIVVSWLRVVTGSGTSVVVDGKTLTVFDTIVFVRGAEWDEDGFLTYIGPEEQLAPGLSLVTLV